MAKQKRYQIEMQDEPINGIYDIIKLTHLRNVIMCASLLFTQVASYLVFNIGGFGTNANVELV